MPRDRAHARALQAEFARQGDPVGWFDQLYRDADGDTAAVPWADLRGNALVEAWIDQTRFAVRGRACAVVGCGLGDDAEALAAAGADVTAFDISPTAIAWCRRRFPNSRVQYVVADLFDLPPAWPRRFDLVVEINTLQALPGEIRPRAIERVADLVAPGGTLLVICRGREVDEPADGPPWPLVRGELDAFAKLGLTPTFQRDVRDDDTPPARRFVAAFTRPR